MKKIAIILFFIISLNVYCQSGSGYAYYSKKAVINDSLVRTSKYIDSKTKDVVSKSIKEIEKFEYVLTFRKNEATYLESSKLNDDSEKEIQIKMARAIVGFNGLIYYNSQNKSLIHKFDFGGTDFLIKSNQSDLNWILLNEKQTIGNILCFKAITTMNEEGRNGLIKKDIVAWYAPKINFNFGPDGFWGLPGLIIQIKTENIITTLSNIKFIDNEIELLKPKDGKEVTKKEFDLMIKELVLNRENYKN